MAARNTVVSIPKGAWTQLTDSDVSALTFLVVNGPVFILAQNGTTAPTADYRLCPRYPTGKGEASDRTLAVLFPGVTSPNRVYAYSPEDPAAVFVSHA